MNRSGTVAGELPRDEGGYQDGKFQSERWPMKGKGMKGETYQTKW